MLTAQDLETQTLGPGHFRSPIGLSSVHGDGLGDFVAPDARIRYQLNISPDAPHQDLSFELAGPREQIFFDPSKTSAAIVTCGGLCPGLNNVIRSVYLELALNYGVARVLGIRNGFLGLNPASGLEPWELTRDAVANIHELGGTVLGSSRGPQDPAVIVDFLVARHINVLFCVGGDGTQRGAHAIHDEIARRGLKIAVVGIPKTIDNDIRYVHRTFGFATALENASNALRCAHVEARGTLNGIGLVKLMGRDAGFITAGATLVSQEVNFCLVPEVAFELEGPNGLLPVLQRRLEKRGHAVIAVAEGAGQQLFKDRPTRFDASGNRLHEDIGPFLKEQIGAFLKSVGMMHSIKYIDPSYLIRSVPANTSDRLLSDQMARAAVHAAMSGKTDTLIGLWNNCFVHVPICTVSREKKRMETTGDLWTSVLLSTGQPRWPATQFAE